MAAGLCSAAVARHTYVLLDKTSVNMSDYFPTPGGPAVLDNQGKLEECTRFALSKAIGNGFWTGKIVKGKDIDISQESIKEVLCNEHKVKSLKSPLILGL